MGGVLASGVAEPKPFSPLLEPWTPQVKLAEGFNGADLRNICTEAGMFAIRDERDYVVCVGVRVGIQGIEVMGRDSRVFEPS